MFDVLYVCIYVQTVPMHMYDGHSMSMTAISWESLRIEKVSAFASVMELIGLCGGAKEFNIISWETKRDMLTLTSKSATLELRTKGR